MNRAWFLAPIAAALALSGCASTVATPAIDTPAAAQASPDPITAAHDGFARETCSAITAGDSALAANLILLHAGVDHPGGEAGALAEAQARCPDYAAALESAANGAP